jgi:hypothetical protein
MISGRSYESDIMTWTKRDVRRLRRCAKRLRLMFSDVFALPPNRDTLKLMQSIESAIMTADVILEKLDGGVDDDEE